MTIAAMEMCEAEFGRGGYRATVPIVRWCDEAMHHVDSICEWCKEKFGKESQRWQRYDSFSILVFDPQDAMLFKLTWCGE